MGELMAQTREKPRRGDCPAYVWGSKWEFRGVFRRFIYGFKGVRALERHLGACSRH